MALAAPQPQRLYTTEEYLDLERRAKFKSEYLNGRIYAMAGGSPEHGAIAMNVGGELRAQLKEKSCRVFSSDVKVRTTPTGLFAYPDVSIVCGALRFHDEHRDVLINPTLLVEVLSPSTEAFDRGQKFLQYQHLESLTDYILISQNTPHIDYFVKQGENEWLLRSVSGLDASLYIASLDCTLTLAEVYDKIEFPTTPADAEDAE